MNTSELTDTELNKAKQRTPKQILAEAFEEIQLNHGMVVDTVKYSFIETDDGDFRIIDIDVSGSVV